MAEAGVRPSPADATVVDAHHHLWRLDQVRWLGPDQPVLYRDYEPPELHHLLAAVGVSRTVCVQANNTLEDTAAMLGDAAENPWIAGVIGWVDLAAPDAGARLDEWQRHPAFKGVRHLLQLEPNPGWLARDDVGRGLAALAERGLPFDVHSLTAEHLDQLARLAASLPGLVIVLDHLASPPIAEGVWEPWASALRRIAAHPNVVAKVSGLGTAAGGGAEVAERAQRYVDHALVCFGADRLMAGSDWPVSLLAATYSQTWTLLDRCLAALPVPDRSAVMGGTAARVYRL